MAIDLPHDDIVRFLEYTPPFNEVATADLEELADTCRVERYPAGTLVLERGKSRVEWLRIIYQGRMRLFMRDEEGQISLEDYRGQGEVVGALAIIRGSLSNLEVVADDETTCILISREDFLELIQSNLGFSRYYLKTITESYVSKALTQLERPRPHVGGEGSLYLFSAQVGDVVRRRPQFIGPEATVQQAARHMDQEKVGCLLITDPAGGYQGIITDRDLRSKVVGAGLDGSTPVSRIMSSPVRSIPAHTVCFDALLEMMKSRVHHLPLSRGDEVVGVISGHDLMVTTGSSPLALVREIASAAKIEDLYDISLKSPRVVASLIYEGARAANVTRMITLINDYILDRVLSLLIRELGQPPVPFCWLMMGSEGRREQTFRTDQDNGLLYLDPTGPDQAKECEQYFHYLGTMAIEHLVACGFPRCPGNIMASNPQWCQPYQKWAGYFDRWIETPEPKEVMHATIFFDFRGGYGDLALARRLRSHLMNKVAGQEVFLRYLAKDTLTTPGSLSFFRNIVTERDGEHSGKLDLKHRGLVPFIDYGRVKSLASGVAETNTLERLQLIHEAGALTRQHHLDLSQAFEFLMQLRLMHQQMQHSEGLEPDNYIDPDQLSEMEKRQLKEALAMIGEIKGELRSEYRLDMG